MTDRTLSDEVKARRVRDYLADTKVLQPERAWLEEYAELLKERPRLRELAQAGVELARRVVKEYGP